MKSWNGWLRRTSTTTSVRVSGTTCWFSVFFDKLLAAARTRGRDGPHGLRAVAEPLGALRRRHQRRAVPRRSSRSASGRPIILMDNYNATEGGIFAVTDRDRRARACSMRARPWRVLRVRPRCGARHDRTHGASRSGRWSRAWTTPSPSPPPRGCSPISSATWCSSRASSPTGWSSWAGRRACSRSRRSSPRSSRSSAPSRPRYARPPARWWSSPPEPRSAWTGPAKGRYQIFVEFDQAPADPRRFARAFDESLCAQNRVYREHRAADVAILPPALFTLAPGGARRFMDELGRRSPQQKFPRVVENSKRDILVKYATLIEMPWERA